MNRLCAIAVFFLAVICDIAQGVAQVDQTSTRAAPAWATRTLRAGMIGTDTSHVPAFAEILRSHPEWKINLVAAFKGGSPDIPASANRVEGFARTAHEKFGVELVESIDALLAKVDVVLLISVDGRAHLAQVTPVLKAGKRGVHRQAVGREFGRRPSDHPARKTDWHAVLQLFVHSIPSRCISAARQSGRWKGDESAGYVSLEQTRVSPRPLLLRHSRC